MYVFFDEIKIYYPVGTKVFNIPKMTFI